MTRLNTRVLEQGAARLGLSLSGDALASLARYYLLLAEWNERVNLTSVDDWNGVVRTHFLDSLTVAKVITTEVPSGGLVVDVGTGAGFPGVPLKIVFPELRLTLVEATGKKVAFLTDLLRELVLTEVEVLHGRAEDLAHEARLRESFDAALARALASMPALVELTLPLVRVGGVLIAQKKGAFGDELSAAEDALQEMGGRLERVETFSLPELAEPRSLVVVRKYSPTPDRYPRRAGMPAKRPILGDGGRGARGQAFVEQPSR